jgi:hypothetical protein
MNERIKELANKALKHPDTDNDGLTVFDNDELEKFAELIVRECIKESMDEIVSDEDLATETDPMIREYLLGQNQGIVDAVVRFRNHFGVTE